MDGNPITIVTTFADRHWKEHAENFVLSLQRFLDKNVNVIIYTDTPYNFDIPNWTNYILNDQCPNLVEFKDRNSHREIPLGTKGWLRDAVRFSHKSYCIIDAAKKISKDRMIWIDADTEIVAPLTEEYLLDKHSDDTFVSYLGRPNRYSETGFLSFDLNNTNSEEYFKRWQWWYDTDLIYHLQAQLDCHVFDVVTAEFVNNNKIIGHSLTNKTQTKNHFDDTFIGVMTHYKGDKKESIALWRERNKIKAVKQASIDANINNRT